MAKNAALEVIWVIVDILPAGKYRVQLSGMDFVVTWHKSGNMKRNNIAIMLGDYVKLEVNEYDNTQGRITYRYKYPPAEVTWAAVWGQSSDNNKTEKVEGGNKSGDVKWSRASDR